VTARRREGSRGRRPEQSQNNGGGGRETMSLRRNGARAKGATAHGTARRATTVIAHRGASYLAPESTRIAYRIARDLGADFLEADLQATADGAIVVHHDDDLRRTTNVAAVYPDRSRSRPGAFTLEELRHPRLDAGAWFNAAHPARASAAFVGQKILTLDDLVGIARDEGPRRPGPLSRAQSARHRRGGRGRAAGSGAGRP
jgi:glycerophosphoryl diester phosphodiesterase